MRWDQTINFRLSNMPVLTTAQQATLDRHIVQSVKDWVQNNGFVYDPTTDVVGSTGELVLTSEDTEYLKKMGVIVR